jgi:predicted transport protein
MSSRTQRRQYAPSRSRVAWGYRQYLHGKRSVEAWKGSQVVADIKLFRIGADGAQELAGASVAVEKTLQILIERNLESLLGVRFLASEHTTGKAHGGRIDTLGIDENGSPVIIEYKRAMNENVINQGLFYLNWLMDHRAEFELLVLRRFGADAGESIDWRYPRLLCIAGDFTKYDEHAVQQIPRNIELIRYRRYDDDLLLLETVNAAGIEPIAEDIADANGDAVHAIARQRERAPNTYRTVLELLAQSPKEVQDRFEGIKAYLLALGDDVQMKPVKFYVAFRRIKNFACIEVHPQTRAILAYVKVDPDTITLEPGFTRDVRNIGHFGTGDLEITIRSSTDFERAKLLLLQSYESS